MITVALNGFGRIGRNFLRTVMLDTHALKKIKIVALNIGPANPQFVAHSFKYDSILGTYPGQVTVTGGNLCIDGYSIKVYAQTDPLQLDWKGIDWVVEASGKFTKKKDAQKHRDSGAGRVLISAPSSDADGTIILGVNSASYSGQTIVSLGSCTTNAVVPLLKKIQDVCGIESAFMTTIHSYTNNQTLLDVDNSDVRRSRAATLNIIPTTTGATKVIGLVLPELRGKVEACSLRVPTPKVSLIDLSFVTLKKITREDLNKTFQKASFDEMKGILSVTDQELVSCDFGQNSHSVIVDSLLTQSVGKLGKVFGWYDNEWGYSCRLKDFLIMFG